MMFTFITKIAKLDVNIIKLKIVWTNRGYIIVSKVSLQVYEEACSKYNIQEVLESIIFPN